MFKTFQGPAQQHRCQAGFKYIKAYSYSIIYVLAFRPSRSPSSLPNCSSSSSSSPGTIRTLSHEMHK
jgi:hypothetical protein